MLLGHSVNKGVVGRGRTGMKQVKREKSMMGMEINAEIEWRKPTRFFPPPAIKTPPSSSLPLTMSSSSSVSSGFSSPAKMEKSKSSQSAVVWDCGSSLFYDSFELNSLKRQLDSAIASRTLSMPHLPARRCVLLSPPPPPPPPSKRHSKISRSLHKFLRSLFRHKPNSSPAFPEVLYSSGDEANSLSAVPELQFAGFSPEIASLVRRSASERFAAATSIGISCA